MNQMSNVKLEQFPYSEAAKKALARKPQLFIDGQWVDSTGGETLGVIDPSSGKEISRFVDASDADVDRAVAAARRAFDDGRWSDLPPIVRETMMRKLADILGAHADELAELEAIDNGKPKGMAGAIDVPGAIGMMHYMAGWATKLGGEMIEPMSAPRGAFHSYVRREPIGVAAQIVPWNFPLLMAVLKISPALAAGCTVVLKPAEQTSLTALRLADFIAEAGIPAGVVNIITGNGHTAGDRLVRHPDVDKVAFTGSTEVGKIINRTATDSLKRVTLELGGKSPVIVLPDVDPKVVGPGTAQAIFFNSGQVCVAGSRLYAHKSVFDSVLESFVEASAFWQPRASLDPDAHMGPLVSDEQMQRVMGYIEDGKKAGASVAVGGDTPASEGGYYVNPTVLVDVKPDMRVVREEIFGPVVVAQRFDDLDEVARQANDTSFGLAAGIWTKDLSAMHKLAAKLKAGTIWGNCHSMIDPALPFGGFKESGLGREQGRQGVEAYTELKSVIIAL
ncbi:phenylacetaldehyde dehydrogenase [Sphingobium sp. B1D7B]|uniref:aldehyde dehydrogenase family protein n=1 Tax=unclassified Sphingobium TaxID=2611147 RepID=UPI0022259731|nr:MULTISPECIES: aldehyde dehydrogenase family protein [unclassified Sphingobium]MCW2390779.1 phenylacetaldehyde dehydrogenase [Sphingobium sp. B11D3A]MCW2405921.1 phenylacetaldehyde dehydrogenase [Sphingobium sp. B1D7B]